METKIVRTQTGERTVKLFARGGHIELADLTDTGELTFVPLERIRTPPHPGEGQHLPLVQRPSAAR